MIGEPFRARAVRLERDGRSRPYVELMREAVVTHAELPACVSPSVHSAQRAARTICASAA